ncbi:AAA family ATPase [Pseudanabaena yagii]|uniref:AAA family ATPase n=1 Tax=Pseudanabaena yagii GIHE-NHR1 TaxID=2722753 RepID=A0ABX1LTS0_9CYAN|nr:ATP/GTP-binding protein [Pseudanabaena yagii]NMF58169.1 AAA family ATPase [Pseudanabaena yagii GIHE-NHR1]
MLKSLKIENFRCFQSFEMQQLGRLNLIVGTNNSGKTSILEAIQLLIALPTNHAILSDITVDRSEYINENSDTHLAIRHLFYNHKIDEGFQISITGIDSSGKSEQTLLKGQKNRDDGSPELYVLHWDDVENRVQNTSLCLPISQDGIIVIDSQRKANWEKSFSRLPPKTRFVSSSSFSSEQMIELFERIVITPEEDLVIDALKIIEHRIKRIANVSSGKYRYEGAHSGFIVQLTDEPQRIPIGSMGDGMWRILGLALAIVNAKDGVLLVDEIDTGLHFTVMSDMWKMLWETAKRLNVQIFATTHSNDCWQSLADIANAENPSEDGITIHRVEKGKTHSIVFTEDEIAIAAEEGIEVR